MNKNWKDYDQNQDDKIGWEEYKNTTYGYYLGNSLVNKLCVHMSCIKKTSSAQVYNWFAGEEFDDVEDKATYQSMLSRDERRFKKADQDGDGIATREEFTAFLHPEEFEYMKDVVVQVEFFTWMNKWKKIYLASSLMVFHASTFSFLLSTNFFLKKNKHL